MIGPPFEPKQQPSTDTQKLYAQSLVPDVAQSNIISFFDIDNTFICHEGHTEPLTTHSYALNAFLTANKIGRILITGAPWSKAGNSFGGTPGVVQRLTTESDSQPSIIPSHVHVIFTDGGLDCYIRNASGDFIRDVSYREFIEEYTSAFNPHAVMQAAETFINVVNEQFGGISLASLASHEILSSPVEHVAIFQLPYCERVTALNSGKISMYVHSENLMQIQTIAGLANKFAQLAGVQCIVCEEKDINNRLNSTFDNNPPVKRYNIDFTAVSKSTPIDYIMQEPLTAISEEITCIVAGDAGNDIPMFQSPFVSHGIIVGGAAAELQNARDLFGTQMKNIFLGKQDELGPIAILKALTQFFPEID